MRRVLALLLLITLSFNFCSTSQGSSSEVQPITDSVTKVEMNLSAFGVESDNFPSIAVYIDFVKDSSNCEKSYYNPAYKGSTYTLSAVEMKKVLELLQDSDINKLKPEYRVSKSDQPTSTTTIYLGQRKIVVKDYGLEGEHPLQELYKLVYKF
jgi:hypothetical protein